MSETFNNTNSLAHTKWNCKYGIAKKRYNIPIKEKTPMATSIQIVWHTHYNTYKKFYQAFLCGQKEKLDL